MSSTNKTSLGLNMWEASDKPVRQDFVNDNVIVDKEVTKLKQDIINGDAAIDEKISKLNSNLNNKANASDLSNTNSLIDNKQTLRITNNATGEASGILSFGYFYSNGKIYINAYIDGAVYGQIPPIS